MSVIFCFVLLQHPKCLTSTVKHFHFVVIVRRHHLTYLPIFGWNLPSYIHYSLGLGYTQRSIKKLPIITVVYVALIVVIIGAQCLWPTVYEDIKEHVVATVYDADYRAREKTSFIWDSDYQYRHREWWYEYSSNERIDTVGCKLERWLFSAPLWRIDPRSSFVVSKILLKDQHARPIQTIDLVAQRLTMQPVAWLVHASVVF